DDDFPSCLELYFVSESGRRKQKPKEREDESASLELAGFWHGYETEWGGKVLLEIFLYWGSSPKKKTRKDCSRRVFLNL
ncbi:hypothetical protein N9561_00475, partial [bacterium]|nr:hypothetical protein [bacterium]